MASVTELLAGIGTRKITASTKINAQDIATSRYTGQIKAQFQQIVKTLSDIVGGIDRITGDILEEALEPTLELAKYYCPVDTGALVESGYLDKISGKGYSRVIIGFGKGGEPPYAALVHELVTHHHKPPTRSKFLLAALTEDQADIYARIKAKFKIP